MAQFVNDTFTASDGTVITARAGEAGATWTALSGSGTAPTIFANYAFAESNGVWYASGAPAGPNYSVTFVYHHDPTNGAIVQAGVRIDTASAFSTLNGYFGFYYSGDGHWYIQKQLGGVITTIASAAASLTTGNDYTGVLTATGTGGTVSLDLTVGGVSVCSGTDSSSPITAAGKAGILTIGTATSGNPALASISADDVAGGALGANTAAVSAVATGSVTVSGTPVTGGTETFSYQLKRGTDGVTFGTNVGSAQVLASGVAPTAVADTGLTDGTAYAYRWSVTDSAGSPATVTSNTVWAVPHAAGSTFYVAAAGSDSNNGLTTGAPWQTAAKVNRYGEGSVLAGDAVRLNGGDTLTGSLLFRRGTASTSAGKPFTLGSYGSGNGVVSCGDADGVKLVDLPHAGVYDLTVTGSGVASDGTTTSTGKGVYVSLTGAADLPGVVIARNTVTGCDTGVYVAVEAGTNRITAPVIAYNTVHACGSSGIEGGHLPGGTQTHDTKITGVTIAANTVYDVYGNAGVHAQTGFGIVFFNLSGGRVEGNLVHHTGAACYPASPGGPVGIVLLESNGVTIARNEVHHSFCPVGIDGQGVDLDGGCVNCVVEGNFVHDCDGPAFMDLKLGGYTQNDGNVFRWNVTQNNGRRSAHASIGNHATFIEVNGATNTTVHNNTEYSAKAAGTESAAVDDQNGGGLILRNNSFTASGSGATFGTFLSGTLLQGNNYDAAGGATFSATYNSVVKTSLASLRAVAETLNGASTGSTTAPAYPSAGGATTVAVGTVARNVTAYDSTALASIGLDLPTAFGTDPGATDFHGGPVRTSAGYPVGAVAAALPPPSSGGGFPGGGW